MNNRELQFLSSSPMTREWLFHDKEEAEKLSSMLSLLDVSVIEQKSQRKRQRLEDCGKSACRIDPHTGNYYWFSQRCGLFRECPTCRKERADAAKESMQSFVASGKDVIVMRLSSGDAKRLCRRYAKDEYVRYPIEGGDDIVFMEEKNAPLDYRDAIEDATLEDIGDFDWETIVTTPEGRNRSGTMLYENDDDNGEEFDFITSPSIVSDAPAEEQSRAMEMAKAKTASLDPQTPEEVEEALNERMWEAFCILKSLGYNPRIYYGMTKVFAGRISWINNPLFKRKKQHEKAPSAQLKML